MECEKLTDMGHTTSCQWEFLFEWFIGVIYWILNSLFLVIESRPKRLKLELFLLKVFNLFVVKFSSNLKRSNNLIQSNLKKKRKYFRIKSEIPNNLQNYQKKKVLGMSFFLDNDIDFLKRSYFTAKYLYFFLSPQKRFISFMKISQRAIPVASASTQLN